MTDPARSPTGKLSEGAEELLERIADPDGRRVVFLFGAALSMPERGTAGVPGVRDIATRIKDALNDRGGLEFDQAFALALETENYGDAYRTGFRALLRRKGQDAVNRVIREAVLDAYQPLDNGRRALALAGHPEEHRGECQALLDDLEGWRPLRGSVAALGDILVQNPDRFGRVLTTNFDPLIEIAVRKAGGQAHLSVLDRDGSPGQHHGTGTHVVHLHGYWFNADTLHTEVQILDDRPDLQASLRRWIERSLLVVLGYGGWDDVLMRSLRAVAGDIGAYPEIAWGFYGSRDLTVMTKLKPAGGRAQFYEQVDMHELLPLLRDRLQDSGSLSIKSADDAAIDSKISLIYTLPTEIPGLKTTGPQRSADTAAIRAGVSDPNTSVVQLAMLTLAHARKHGDREMARWLNLEIRGYHGTDVPIPEYRRAPVSSRANLQNMARKISGQPIPMQNLESNIREDRRIPEDIRNGLADAVAEQNLFLVVPGLAEVERYAQRSVEENIQAPWPDQITSWSLPYIFGTMQATSAWQVVPPAVFRRALEGVRMRIFDYVFPDSDEPATLGS